MKAVIFAGGLGTRLSEETVNKPKPMVEIGAKPILWHIMKTYSKHGVKEFIICCGYKGYLIKEYFANYFLHMSDITIDFKTNEMKFHNKKAEDWKVTLVDTGDNSMTGGRLKRIKSYIKKDKFFFLTYGDGLSDIDISASLKFHLNHGKLATVTAVQQPGRFGVLSIKEANVTGFKEKLKGSEGQINGGYFILNPSCIELIDDDATIWEHEPLEKLSKMGELMAYQHDGFWQPMDTLRDKILLEELWLSGKAPWKVW
jgi:glucose-1-phosphate cytidylyltransferase